MSTKIALIAPTDYLYQTARDIITASNYSIRVEKGLLSQGASIAKHLAGEGVEIVISRGETAYLIQKAHLGLNVVEVPVTGFDIIRAVKEAREYGKQIAVVAFGPMIAGIDYLESILGVIIKKHIIIDESEAEEEVLKAFKEGADVVVGGGIATQVAQRHKLPHVLIRSGQEAIVQAINEAFHIEEARRIEKVKSNILRAVLDYISEGIITTDAEGKITLFNPAAERVTGQCSIQAVGRYIDDVCPELNISQIVSAGSGRLGKLLKINGAQLRCNTIPIIVNGNPAGAVATFQDLNRQAKIQTSGGQKIDISEHKADFIFDHVLGNSQQIASAVNDARRFALTDSVVLILGETGTGKEIFAQSIHNYSKRAKGPFVALNCAALPEQILESELFGYAGGAFTGANRDGKTGMFELANSGTIFLDEIAEMDYLVQGKLLRVLQEKKIMRLGSDRVIPVDVRVIAATNKNLFQLVETGKFRADLYYRLNVLRLYLPPLRTRSEDIKSYALFFLDKQTGGKLRFTSDALEALAKYSWPGNVRELKNVIERIAAVCVSGEVNAAITTNMLYKDYDGAAQTPFVLINQSDEFENIKKALLQTKGKHAEAAKILGISRSTLWRKMKTLGIKC